MAVRETTINLPPMIDGLGNPITGFDSFQLIGADPNQYLTVDGAEELIITLIKKATASDGSNSFAVIAPLDITPNTLQWRIVRDVGHTNKTYNSTSFAYSATPLALSAIIPGTSGTGARVAMTNKMIDGLGNPINGVIARVRPATDFFDTTTGEEILSSVFVASTSDSGGNVSFALPPNSHSSPEVYWLYYDDNSGAKLSFTVSDSGGTIYDNLFQGPLGAVTNPAFNPMTAQDDLIIGGTVAGGLAAPVRLGKGSDGQVLTVDPSTHHLTWEDAVSPLAVTGVGGTVNPTSAIVFNDMEVTAVGPIASVDSLPFVASGSGHKIGAVPDPGSSAGTTKYLREDATWQVPPGSVDTLAIVTADYTVLVTDRYVEADCTAGVITLLLPDAALYPVGKVLNLKKYDATPGSNAVILDTTSSQHIDTYASGAFTWNTQGQSYSLVSNGSNWRIV